jgi:hypothetical protein
MFPIIGLEREKAIVQEYEKILISHVKIYHHLHPFSKNANVDQGVNENCSLDIFEMITSTNEPAKKFVNKEVLIFRRFQMNTKDIKCPLQWWEKHESMLPKVGFLARQILINIDSQIKTKKIFFFGENTY